MESQLRILLIGFQRLYNSEEYMKRLLFSHKSDIDGMGEVVLSLIAFGNIEYILCKNIWDLEQQFLSAYDNNIFNNYDLIYITDLSLTREALERIVNDEDVMNKLYIFDHHETALDCGLNKYPNFNIRIEDENGPSCATQIYYEYLVENNYIQRNELLDQYVEMTRREDTYEWKRLNDTASHDLAILYNQVGYAQYIDLMHKKLKAGINSTNTRFEFDNLEKAMIEQKKSDIEEKVKGFVKQIRIKDIALKDGEIAKVGICFIIYEYRNEIADFIKFRQFDSDNINPEVFNIDVIAMIAMEVNQVSLRSIKDNGYARKVAELYGGGGHDNAAGIPISEEIYLRLINQII